MEYTRNEDKRGGGIKKKKKEKLTGSDTFKKTFRSKHKSKILLIRKNFLKLGKKRALGNSEPESQNDKMNPEDETNRSS